MHSKKESQAATKIQAQARGFLARKSYQIKQLTNKELKNYKVMIKGNDPAINGLPEHAAEEDIALIGTSGMRSIEIACQLTEGAPKLIILDNSVHVINFWRAARDIMNQSDDQESFLQQLKNYVSSTACNRSPLTDIEFEYLETLFKTYPFHQLKQIIIKATILGQSWADEGILVKLKNILAYNSITTIYAYPSNIVAYLNSKEDREKVLLNIEKLNPAIAIHTDLVNRRRFEKSFFIPEKVFLITDHTPAYVKQKIKLEENNKPAASHDHSNSLTINVAG